ncbi:epigen [Oncorhynchus kisutch]|uniref:Epithelial mitogen homolog (mouse) n=1 Tax=Oncorhynchus kisutch TaxID=8019 RepID=A0A8C7MSH6_ONCKI|nr:epigen-like [Oncorhynchus kisutch]
MSGPKQTVTAFSTTLVTMLLILSTVTQSAEPSDNLQPTQRTLSLDLAEPTNTALPVNGSDAEEPRVLRMSKPCKDEDADYCLNGQCMYPPDSDTPACTCDVSYSGPRCGLLTHQATQCKFAVAEEVIGICVGVALLVCCLAVVLYCCIKRRCEKKYLPYKTYGGSENSV